MNLPESSSKRFKALLNPLKANPTKWSTNCLSVFDHFVGLALKGLNLSFTKVDVVNSSPLKCNIYQIAF